MRLACIQASSATARPPSRRFRRFSGGVPEARSRPCANLGVKCPPPLPLSLIIIRSLRCHSRRLCRVAVFLIQTNVSLFIIIPTGYRLSCIIRFYRSPHSHAGVPYAQSIHARHDHTRTRIWTSALCPVTTKHHASACVSQCARHVHEYCTSSDAPHTGAVRVRSAARRCHRRRRSRSGQGFFNLQGGQDRLKCSGLTRTGAS